MLTWQEKRDNLVNSIDNGAGSTIAKLSLLWKAFEMVAGEYQQAKNIAFLEMPRSNRASIRKFLVNLK